MNRIRWALAALVIASLVTMIGMGSATAQDATPISVPTPPPAGCDQVPAYVEARQKIMNELLNGIAEVFPGVATPVTEHGDQLMSAMMAMTPDQTKALGKLYGDIAGKIEKVNAPEIAVFYNDQVVLLYRTSGMALDEAATIGLSAAGQKYGTQLGAIANAISEYGAAAADVCPAFADVIEIDQTQIGL